MTPWAQIQLRVTEKGHLTQGIRILTVPLLSVFFTPSQQLGVGGSRVLLLSIPLGRFLSEALARCPRQA